ncbi:MAG: DNA-processing protein DprA [Acidimicrobiales bacterium]
MSACGHLPPEAFAAALADLPGMGPTRLAGLLRQDSPPAIWQQVAQGRIRRRTRAPRDAAESPSADPSEWALAAARVDVQRRWQAIRQAKISVHYLGGTGMPSVLAEDPQAPGVLFCQGALEVLRQPRVAVVGTRHCTGYGLDVARKLGHDLAAAGVCVVSGLALGIDGAAHEGALQATGGAGPLGIAASGVDVPYPPRHAALWGRVIQKGAIVSETPPGRQAQAWRFPSRNRLIAAVARALVVVESHAGGGSMLTVAAAAERGIEILAVPGPVNSRASEGTNQLLYDGLAPARHAGDVLAALGDLRPWPPPLAGTGVTGLGTKDSTAGDSAAGGRSRSARSLPPPQAAGRYEVAAQPTPSAGAGAHGQRQLLASAGGQPPAGAANRSSSTARLEPALRRVLDAVDTTPTPTSLIATRTGLPLSALSSVLIRLEASALVRGQGTWWERLPK